MAAKPEEVLASLNADPSLQFIYTETDLERAIGRIDTPQKLEMAFKKALLYSNRVVVLTKPRTAGEQSGDGSDNNYSDDYDVLFTESEISKSIREIHDRNSDNASFLKSFAFLPESLTWESRYTDSFYNIERDTRSVFDFSSQYKNRAGIRIALTDPTVVGHVFERYASPSLATGRINVWLPELRNLPLDLLLKVREDQEDAFRTFQYSLKDFLSGLEHATDETRLLELFQYVDHEVRELESRFVRLKKMRTLAHADAAVGFALMGVTFFLPPDIAKAVLAVVGSFQLKEYKSKLFKAHEKQQEYKSSDFYAPWYLESLNDR